MDLIDIMLNIVQRPGMGKAIAINLGVVIVALISTIEMLALKHGQDLILLK